MGDNTQFEDFLPKKSVPRTRQACPQARMQNGTYTHTVPEERRSSVQPGRFLERKAHPYTGSSFLTLLPFFCSPKLTTRI